MAKKGQVNDAKVKVYEAAAELLGRIAIEVPKTAGAIQSVFNTLAKPFGVAAQRLGGIGRTALTILLAVGVVLVVVAVVGGGYALWQWPWTKWWVAVLILLVVLRLLPKKDPISRLVVWVGYILFLTSLVFLLVYALALGLNYSPPSLPPWGEWPVVIKLQPVVREIPDPELAEQLNRLLEPPLMLCNDPDFHAGCQSYSGDSPAAATELATTVWIRAEWRVQFFDKPDYEGNSLELGPGYWSLINPDLPKWAQGWDNRIRSFKLIKVDYPED